MSKLEIGEMRNEKAMGEGNYFELIVPVDHGVCFEFVDPFFVFFGAFFDVDRSFHSFLNFFICEGRARTVVDFENFNDGEAGRIF